MSRTYTQSRGEVDVDAGFVSPTEVNLTVVNSDGYGAGVRLTPTEARRIADGLVRLADAADLAAAHKLELAHEFARSYGEATS